MEAAKPIMLYNKYRPKLFADLIGQEHISEVLKGLLTRGQYKVINSIVMGGSPGGGKTTGARIFAKAVNCLDLKAGEPCEACEHCKQFDAKVYPDFIEIDGASYNKVEDARVLIDQANRFPQVKNGYRIMLVDEAHRLSNAAWDLFLKLLEEGENKTIFLFATTEPNAIRPAILSRSFVFTIKPLEADDIYKLLRKICKAEGIKHDKEALQVIAKTSVGKTRDAVKNLDLYWKAKGEVKDINIDVVENKILDSIVSAFSGNLDVARKIVDSLLKFEFNVKDTIAKAIFGVMSHGQISGEYMDEDVVLKAKNTLGAYIVDISQEYLIYKPDSLDSLKLFLAIVAMKGLGTKNTVNSNLTKGRRVRDSIRKSTEHETESILVEVVDKKDLLSKFKFTEITEV